MEHGLDLVQERAGRLYRMILFGAPVVLIRSEMELVQKAINEWETRRLLQWIQADPERAENLRRALWPEEV